MALRIRSHFYFAGTVNWFPGHMVSALKDLTTRLAHCHLLVEVRDARAPLSSTSGSLDDLRKRFPHCQPVLIFNKSDLVDPVSLRATARHFAALDVPCWFGSTRDKDCARKIVALLTRSLHRPPAGTTTHVPWAPSKHAIAAVVGMPNVGKSSLINVLRQHTYGSGTHARLAD